MYCQCKEYGSSIEIRSGSKAWFGGHWTLIYFYNSCKTYCKINVESKTSKTTSFTVQTCPKQVKGIYGFKIGRRAVFKETDQVMFNALCQIGFHHLPVMDNVSAFLRLVSLLLSVISSRMPTFHPLILTVYVQDNRPGSLGRIDLKLYKREHDRHLWVLQNGIFEIISLFQHYK